MVRIISAVSGKGGAGKTTAVILLAGEYALAGKRVLLVDADGRQNLREWWRLCQGNDNLPENIELISAVRSDAIEAALARGKSDFEVVIMDSPGQDTATRDTMIRHSDIVITPIQPNADEIKAAGEAAAAIADVADETGTSIPQANFVTRVTLQSRALEAYRRIRPFVQTLQDNEYDSHLLETELVERNCYREIRNGYGTLQMLQLTDPVRKARAEVMRLKADIEGLLEKTGKQ